MTTGKTITNGKNRETDAQFI